MQASPFPSGAPPPPGDSPSFSTLSNPLSPGSSSSMPPPPHGQGQGQGYYHPPGAPPAGQANGPPYPQGPGGWMQYPNQAPPFYPNGPARPNGNARYDGGQGHGGHGQGQGQGYQMYPGYYPNYPQMGGPGPGTMQNGYGGGYDGYHGMRYPPNGYGYEGDEVMSPPPNGPNADHPMGENFDNGFQMPNGHNPQNFPYYPPNHPYAYGVGVGYPYPPPQTYGYGYNEFPPPSGPPPIPGKLNPAAQGFQFAPPLPPQPTLLHNQKGGPIPPSSLPPAAQPPPQQPYEPPHVNGDAVTPTFASIHRNEAPSQPVSAPKPKAFGLPVIVDGEKLKGLGARRPSQDGATGSLGLTNLVMPSSIAPEPVETTPSEPAESLAASTTLTAASSTPAMSSSPTTSTSPTSVQTPKVPTSEHSLLASPKTGAQDGQWTFTGSTISDASPPPSATVRSFSQAISSNSTPSRSVSSSAKKQKEPAADGNRIRLIRGRPAQDVEGNFFAASLQQNIPSKTGAVVVEGGEGVRRSGKGRATGRSSGAVFATGSTLSNPSSHAHGLIFGTLESLDPSIPSISQPPPAAPAPPRVKPSSWAALLKPAGLDPSSRQFLRTASAPSAFSASPSPSSSRVPLPSSMQRKPSSQGHTPEQQTSEPTTPRMTQSPLLPPSTGFSTTSNRPNFNYAAAAAVGAALNPQDELVRILAEGVRVTGHKPALGLARGLINTGNMCFANTTLQVLVYCPPFTELFEELGKRLKADLGRKTPLLEAMIIFLREFQPTLNGPSAPPSVSGTSTPRSEVSTHVPNGISTPRAKRDASVSASRREAFIPENVYDAMKENKRFDSMRRGYQEDAEEYLGFFLNTLHEELLYLLSRTHIRSNGSAPRTVNGDEREIERPVSPSAKAEEGWLEVGKKQRTNVVRTAEVRETAISRIFGGTLRSVLHTPGSKDSVTLEPYQPLQLDISDSSDILSALRHLSMSETVPVWSATRSANVDATKTVYIEKFPPVLILHLKRFVYDPMEQSVVKRGKPVAYGTELVIPPEIISPGRRAAGAVKYKLFGVIYHHGPTASGGHYTVTVSRQDSGGWIHFDDDNVNIIPTSEVVVSPEEVESGRSLLVGGRERCAYLLFYQRVRA